MAAKFFYAFLVTLVVIFATIAVSRAAERAKKLEEKRDKGILGLGGGRSKDYQEAMLPRPKRAATGNLVRS